MRQMFVIKLIIDTFNLDNKVIKLIRDTFNLDNLPVFLGYGGVRPA